MANVPRPDELAALADLLALAPAADRARLAGVGAARPLMTARAVQLAREALYARARLGEDDPRTRGVVAKAQIQSARVDRLEAEFQRAQVEAPKPSPDATIVHGRVLENGVGRAGLTVSARGSRGEVLGFGCSDGLGAFAMTVPGQTTIRLRVTAGDGTVLYAGTEDIAVAPGRVIYREIRLGEKPPDICAPPTDDPPTQSVKVPDLVGRTEAEAARLAAAVGMRLGPREEIEAPDSVGRIVRQTPAANSEAPPGSSIAIVVGARPDIVVPEVVGMRPADARALIEKAGLSVGTITTAVDDQRQGLVVKQDPAAGSRAAKGSGVALVVARTKEPAGPELVLALAAADARFPAARLPPDRLAAAAERLGLRDRGAIERLVGLPDEQLRDGFGLSLVEEAQQLRLALRSALSLTG